MQFSSGEISPVGMLVASVLGGDAGGVRIFVRQASSRPVLMHECCWWLLKIAIPYLYVLYRKNSN
jgi:hypothetical protein